MNPTGNGEQKATRQCWECLKRRLVCDHTLPHCKKCQKAGRDCPGYDEHKPLQWVQTGKVSSRRRKKDVLPKVYTVTSREKGSSTTVASGAPPCFTETDTDLQTTGLEDGSGNFVISSFDNHCRAWTSFMDLQLAQSCFLAQNQAEWDHQSKHGMEKMLKDLVEKQAKSADDTKNLFKVGGKAKIEEVVAKKQHEEAARMLRYEREPLKKLERLLWMMRKMDLPSYEYLSDQTSEVVQAVHYYNGRIHQDAVKDGELAPNPALTLFPLHALHLLPPTIHHILVCLTLNHFINSLPDGSSREIASVQQAKVYRHRGAAIRSLSHYVGQDHTKCLDLTIASVLMFLTVELQSPAYADWRSHTYGLQRMIDMRGGLKTMMKQAPYLAPTLIVYILVVILGNTCSPSWDQISISMKPDEQIEEVKELYSLIFPYALCPPDLFLEVIRVNQLRLKASAGMLVCEIDPDHTLEAHDLLHRIEAFCPENWAQPGEFMNEWITIGSIYQASLAIYATMSLQSLTVLPNNLEMNQMREVHGNRLLALLEDAVDMPRIHRFLVWPLVVAGVEAIHRDQVTRYRIEQNLAILCRLLGSSSPLKARAVLRRYWKKGEAGWDECFDSPFVFII